MRNQPIFEAQSGLGNIEVCEREGVFYFTIENEWAGSTDTGFGAETSVTLSVEQAIALRDWLFARLVPIHLLAT